MAEADGQRQKLLIENWLGIIYNNNILQVP